MVWVLMIQKSWPTTTKSKKEMDDMKKYPVKKVSPLIGMTPEEMDK